MLPSCVALSLSRCFFNYSRQILDMDENLRRHFAHRCSRMNKQTLQSTENNEDSDQ